MKRIVVTVVAAGLALSGATTVATAAPNGTTPPGFEPAPIPFGKCESASLQRAGAECGLLEVPLDYAKPGGTKIKIAVSRIKHKVADDKFQGIMLTNPGGPGGSGLGLSRLGQLVPDKAGDAYDWIGFDPRGVGKSEPQVSCDGNYFSYNRPYYVPVSSELEQAWLAKAKGYADACKAKNGEVLEHLKTTDNANDMESIRKALGQQQINYYGFSYGTYLGQVYSSLYPERVRRMVFDGTVDPRDIWYDANLNQDVAFDRNIKVYFDWIARNDATYKLGTTAKQVEKLYYTKLEELRRKPADGVIGPDEWTDAFLQAGYYVFGWTDIAAAFSAYVHKGDAKPIKDLYDASNGQGPGADNGYAVYLGTQCTDLQWPKSWIKWRIDNWITFAKAPFETWGNAWFNAPCLNWGAKAGKPVRVDGRKVPSLLMINETLDAATPYEGALEVRSRYPNAALIEGVGGTTHSGSLNGVECTDNAIADYLTSGKLPARKPGRRSDAQCDPVPQPEATAPAAKSAEPTAKSAGMAVRQLVRR
ncbi:alpha/beta hydrolase [Kibdelosporangium phytohabitans]|uniref:Peptidase n=1 Tax=Kibdelosporangium phytohabitans TaxID=860235 RepID=A0A0N9HQN2_9PSEU|nr:alpha/beta hydrolase [Kibdelosporangium phytohabitans]ALG07064.1 peptidase [Kibdelosporangium phytohabitans]MBE1468364.1 pimeloyl-ACP methyl ester carboxylesterase [Kibdelosporangium phytohabitans]